ncbi:hypothetical protein RAA17_14180 [Komagataeibacter rhaeticus]|nr:hypothetical protein [Komagataeibacter rhaeticus]
MLDTCVLDRLFHRANAALTPEQHAVGLRFRATWRRAVRAGRLVQCYTPIPARAVGPAWRMPRPACRPAVAWTARMPCLRPRAGRWCVRCAAWMNSPAPACAPCTARWMCCMINGEAGAGTAAGRAGRGRCGPSWDSGRAWPGTGRAWRMRWSRPRGVCP